MDPLLFSITQPQIRLKDYNLMPYLHKVPLPQLERASEFVVKDLNVVESMPFKNLQKAVVENPLFDTYFHRVVSSSKRTEVLVIQRKEYLKF